MVRGANRWKKVLGCLGKMAGGGEEMGKHLGSGLIESHVTWSNYLTSPNFTSLICTRRIKEIAPQDYPED